MIEIKDEKGRCLELPPDTTLEQELNSWLLADDNLPGSWSYSFRFAFTPNNMAFVKHKHRLEASSFVGIDVTVSIDGIPWGPAVLNFRVTDGYADAFLVFDAGTLASLLSTKSIADVFRDDSFLLTTSPELLPAAMAQTLDPVTSPWPFVFFPVYNPEFTNRSNVKKEEGSLDGFRYNPFVNEYRLNGFIGDFRTETVAGFQQVLTYGNGVVPYFYLWWVIERVVSYLGYTSAGTWLLDPDMRRLVMYNNVSINVGIGTGVSVQPRFHVWSMKLNEFFRFLRNDLGVGIFFDARTQQVVIRPVPEIITQAPKLDLSNARISGHTIDPIRQGGYTIQFPTVGDEKDSFSTPADYVIGTGETTYAMKLSTLPMTLQKRTYGALLGTTLGANFLVPFANEKGQSLDFRFEAQKQYSLELPNTAPRLLMYLGLHADQFGNLYPLGSSISRNYNQDNVAGLSVHPDEPNSIFHRWVRPLWELKAFSKPVTQRFAIKIGQARAARLWEPILTESIDHVKLPCLLQKVVTRWPSIDGKLLSQATLFPIVAPPDYTPKIPHGIWVRAVVENMPMSFESAPITNVYKVTFQFFFDANGTMPQLVSKELTFYYSYQTGSYDSEKKEFLVSTIQKAVRLETPAVELTAEAFWATWSSDSQQEWMDSPDSVKALKNTLRIIPGAGYRITNG